MFPHWTNRSIQGSTTSHTSNKGKASSIHDSHQSKKRKLGTCETTCHQPVEPTDIDIALLHPLVSPYPSDRDTSGFDLDPAHVDVIPSKKRKVGLYSFRGPSLVGSILACDGCQNARKKLQPRESFATQDSETPSSPDIKAPKPKAPKETMSIIARKEFLIRTPTKLIERSMRLYVAKMYVLFGNSSLANCWLHPNPPKPSRLNGQSPSAIKCHFSWKDNNNVYHSIAVNYGIVALIVKARLTSAQKMGFMYNSWHLSHLCGNWTCCNWKHFTIEPGSTNISRNPCLLSDGLRKRKSDGICKHLPQCMREKKIKDLMSPPIATDEKQTSPCISETSSSETIETSPSLLQRIKTMV